MGFERTRRSPGLAERFDAAFLNDLCHGFDEMQEYLVASRQRNCVMKRCIAFGAQAAGIDLRTHLRHGSFHCGQVVFTSMSRRQLRELDLECFTCLEHVRQTAAPLEQLRQRIPKASCTAEKGAFPVTDVDEAQRLKYDKRLAHGRAAYMQAVRQLALGRELVTGRHTGLGDEVGQPFADVLVQAAALERTKRCGGWRAHRAESSRRTGSVVQPLTRHQGWTNLGPNRFAFGTAGGRLMKVNHGRTLASVVATAFALAACGTTATPASHLPTGPVTMGVLSCFTGSLSSLGDAMLQGSQVAKKAINDAGGILGQQLVINHADTQCDEADAKPAVGQLLAASNVVGIIGPETQEINAVAPIVSSAKVPTQFQGGSTLFDKNANSYLWRDSPSDSQLGVAMALYAFNKGYKKADLIFYSDVAAQTFPPPITNTFKKLGGTVINSYTIAPKLTSYQTTVQKVIADAPDVIFTQTDAPTAAVLFRNFQSQDNLAIPFVGTDVTSGDDYLKAITWPVAHDHLVSIYGTSVSGAATDEFNRLFALVVPGANQQPLGNANYAYDAVISQALAIDQAKSIVGPDINAAMLSVTNPPGTQCYTYAACYTLIKAGTKINYEGASGPLDYNQYHNVFGPYAAWQESLAGKQVLVPPVMDAAALGAATP